MQLVLLGTGDAWMEAALHGLAMSYPGWAVGVAEFHVSVWVRLVDLATQLRVLHHGGRACHREPLLCKHVTSRRVAISVRSLHTNIHGMSARNVVSLGARLMACIESPVSASSWADST